MGKSYLPTMRLEDYTPDAICQAMNLSGFIEPSWTQIDEPTLRVVLKPSFHPELCITVARTAEAATISVVALTQQFWGRQRGEVYLPSDREQVQVSGIVFEEVIGLFRKAYGALGPDRRHVFCDGMSSESCLVSRNDGIQRLSVHVSAHRANAELLGRLFDIAWNSCQRPGVRNALAQATLYLDIKYALQELPPESPVSRLAILGTPDQRRDYLRMLKQQKEDGDEPHNV